MLAALQDTEHTAHVYADTVSVRRWFGKAVAENGIIVNPSQADFVLATFPEAAEGRIHTHKGANWSPFPETM